ncbi:uncharacterized protein [Zea mays]|uniref:uncharacterized protein n=1 Tax=Zea mays TaxID=4577 RepID=UPI001651B453|nr:uncharacterized protein LOC118472297 [Zea mays]
MARALRADEDRTPATSEAPVRTRHHANKWGPLLGLMDTCSYLCAHKHVGPSVSDAVFVRTTPTSPPWTPTWLRAFFDRVVKISAGLGNHHCTTPPSAPADYKIGYWSVKGAASPQSDGCVTSTEDCRHYPAPSPKPPPLLLPPLSLSSPSPYPFLYPEPPPDLAAQPLPACTRRDRAWNTAQAPRLCIRPPADGGDDSAGAAAAASTSRRRGWELVVVRAGVMLRGASGGRRRRCRPVLLRQLRRAVACMEGHRGQDSGKEKIDIKQQHSCQGRVWHLLTMMSLVQPQIMLCICNW